MSNTVYISMFIVWSAILVGALLTEIMTSIYLGWSATISAFFAIIVHAATKNIVAEVVTFATSWFVLWILMVFLMVYIFKKKTIHDSEDGYLGFIGKEYVVSKSNKLGYGEIKDNDKVFRFSSKDKLLPNDKVIVNKIKGVTFIVEKTPEKKEGK